jgi:hypothetical protein
MQIMSNKSTRLFETTKLINCKQAFFYIKYYHKKALPFLKGLFVLLCKQETSSLLS